MSKISTTTRVATAALDLCQNLDALGRLTQTVGCCNPVAVIRTLLNLGQATVTADDKGLVFTPLTAAATAKPVHVQNHQRPGQVHPQGGGGQAHRVGPGPDSDLCAKPLR
ncbi:MAG: hypothetical protein IPJ18_20215 [Betaproteobacteria bacterium]|nr:hypothetical protein [Betaproteobacteria bacterium]